MIKYSGSNGKNWRDTTSATLKGKIENVQYISAGSMDKDSLSLSLSLSLSEKNRTYTGYKTYVYFSMKQNVEKFIC